MALYVHVSSLTNAAESIKITSTIQNDGYTLYVIKISIPPYTWTCHHRYSEFRDLNDKLVTNYGIDKALLPPKKLFGNQNDSFIQKRQVDLELYLQNVFHRLTIVPDPLSAFLDFPKFEVRCIVDKLSEMLFFHGDEILAGQSEFIMSPLQLYALTERLQLSEPTCASGDKKRDLGHTLAFISQLRNLTIKGSSETYDTSDIIPNNLPYDLSSFKSLIKLTVFDSCLKGNLKNLASLRNTVTSIVVRNSLEDLSSVLLGEVVHWSPMDSYSYWPYWHKVVEIDFSQNKISLIDPCIRLLLSLESLDLSNNLICNVENLESLPHLSKLNLSNNHICHLDSLHTRLGNVKTLLLAGNYISSLQGLSRLYSLVALDLKQNQISQLKEIEHLGTLPCLESLNLSSNPVTSILDYRPNVLLAFVPRAAEILLDGQKTSQKEIDKVSILQALKAAKEGRVLRPSVFYDSSNPRSSYASATTNTEVVVHPREFGSREPDYPEVPVHFDPHTEEFRKKISALRRLGGNDWLRLFNQLVKETPKAPLDPLNHNGTKVDDDDTKKGLEGNTDEFTNYTDILCEKDGQTECFYKGQMSSGNVLLPDWLCSLTLNDFKFRGQVLREMNKEENNENRLVCEIPIWSTWVLIMSGDDANFKRYPACIVLTASNIYILELCTLVCHNSEGYRNQPETMLKMETFLMTSDMKYVVSGPYNAYLEMHCGHEEGPLKIVIWTGELQMQSLTSKLRHHYGFQISSKYALDEIFDYFQHAALTYDSFLDSTLAANWGPRFKILACEAICRVQTEEASKCCLAPQNCITLLAVTEHALLILEECFSILPKGISGPFKISHSQEINSYVRGISMRDGGPQHTCCCHNKPATEQSNNSVNKSDSCCFIHELFTCGYWLLIDFEGNSSLKARFFTRESRSRILEAFLASRNQKL